MAAPPAARAPAPFPPMPPALRLPARPWWRRPAWAGPPAPSPWEGKPLVGTLARVCTKSWQTHWWAAAVRQWRPVGPHASTHSTLAHMLWRPRPPTPPTTSACSPAMTRPTRRPCPTPWTCPRAAWRWALAPWPRPLTRAYRCVVPLIFHSFYTPHALPAWRPALRPPPYHHISMTIVPAQVQRG